MLYVLRYESKSKVEWKTVLTVFVLHNSYNSCPFIPQTTMYKISATKQNGLALCLKFITTIIY